MKTHHLNVFEGHPLPVDVATYRIFWEGITGSGKTYGAGRFAEELLRLLVQTVIVDTIGKWFGLRVAADGKGKGYDVIVLGGVHRDEPITPESGALVADLVVDTGMSFVLDISQFSIRQRQRFLADFANRFWERRKQQADPAPVHVILEECQLVVPQRLASGTMEAYEIWEEMIRLGRNYGIGVSMVSQRPQSVNNEVLTQAEIVVAFQTNGTPERDTMRKWLVAQEASAHVNLVDELPRLEVGRAFLWSPSRLRVLKRVRVTTKHTFDSTATPRAGQRRIKATVTPLDLSKLRDAMHALQERTASEDPVALRRRIAELQRQLAERPASAPTRVEVPVMDAATLQRLEQAATAIQEAAGTASTAAREVAQKLSQRPPAAATHTASPPRPSPRAHPSPAPGSAPVSVDSPGLGEGHRRMLAALALRYPTPLSKVQLGILSGYAPGGGTFRTYLPVLRRHQLVEVIGEDVRLTPQGLEEAGGIPASAPRTAEQVRRMWLDSLEVGPRRMLEELIAVHPDVLTAELLGERSGYAASGGTFRTYLPKLTGLRLAERVGGKGGPIRASDTLFGDFA